jgi:hypothetical protein
MILNISASKVDLQCIGVGGCAYERIPSPHVDHAADIMQWFYHIWLPHSLFML